MVSDQMVIDFGFLTNTGVKYKIIITSKYFEMILIRFLQILDWK